MLIKLKRERELDELSPVLCRCMYVCVNHGSCCLVFSRSSVVGPGPSPGCGVACSRALEKPDSAELTVPELNGLVESGQG